MVQIEGKKFNPASNRGIFIAPAKPTIDSPESFSANLIGSPYQGRGNENLAAPAVQQPQLHNYSRQLSTHWQSGNSLFFMGLKTNFGRKAKRRPESIPEAMAGIRRKPETRGCPPCNRHLGETHRPTSSTLVFMRATTRSAN